MLGPAHSPPMLQGLLLETTTMAATSSTIRTCQFISLLAKGVPGGCPGDAAQLPRPPLHPLGTTPSFLPGTGVGVCTFQPEPRVRHASHKGPCTAHGQICTHIPRSYHINITCSVIPCTSGQSAPPCNNALTCCPDKSMLQFSTQHNRTHQMAAESTSQPE